MRSTSTNVHVDLTIRKNFLQDHCPETSEKLKKPKTKHTTKNFPIDTADVYSSCLCCCYDNMWMLSGHHIIKVEP